MENNKKILIVDGMALLFRAYYVSAYGGYIQKTKNGLPTNAVNGFVKYLCNAVEAFNPLMWFTAGIWEAHLADGFVFALQRKSRGASRRAYPSI